MFFNCKIAVLENFMILKLRREKLFKLSRVYKALFRISIKYRNLIDHGCVLWSKITWYSAFVCIDNNINKNKNNYSNYDDDEGDDDD